MIPVPFEIRVFISPARKIETGPSFDFIGLTELFCSLVGVYFPGHEFFGIVRSGFVVHHGIQIDTDLIFVQLVDHFL